MELRQQGKTEDDVFQAALRNLESCSVVGTQERLSDFGDELKHRYGVELQIERVNVTQNKAEKRDVRVQTIRRIQDWVYMDLELYQHVLTL